MSETNERDEKNEQDAAGGAEPARKTPSVFRNYISFAGTAIAAAGFVSIALMLLLEFVGGEAHGSNPYTGIFTYILFPSVMGFGIVLFLIGGAWERHRRHKMKPDEIGRYPVLDLNDPRRRRTFITVMLLSLGFLFISALGTYRAFEHTESVQFCGQTCHTVMKPEFTAYQAGAPARAKRGPGPSAPPAPRSVPRQTY